MGNQSSKIDQQQIIELKKHIEYLQKHTTTLNTKIKTLETQNNLFISKINELNTQNKQLETLSIKNINKKQIQDGVKKILDNPETNSKMIPDYLESKLYENCISVFLEQF